MPYDVRKKFHRRDLIHAWRERVIPQIGKLSKGIKYQMHGIGCAVYFLDHKVDFDFATQYEAGFKVWRLWLYAKQFPECYPEYQSQSSIENVINEVLSKEEIFRNQYKYQIAANANGRIFMLSMK